MPEFNARPGGTFAWKHGHIDYGAVGGAAAYDYPDVLKGDIITIALLHPGVGNVTCNLLYPDGKQSQAQGVAWGARRQFVAEQDGAVAMLVSANGDKGCRVVVRR